MVRFRGWPNSLARRCTVSWDLELRGRGGAETLGAVYGRSKEAFKALAVRIREYWYGIEGGRDFWGEGLPKAEALVSARRGLLLEENER